MRDGTFATSGSTSSTLLGRVRERDPVAWTRLTGVYAPLVYRWGRHAKLGSEDAADLVQEVFQVVSARIDAYNADRADASFRGWLWGITKNKLHEFHRSRRSHPLATGGTDAQQQLAQFPESPAEQGDEPTDADAATRLVRRALQMIRGDFNETTWQAFERATFENHAAADIAADLNITVGAVYKAKSRVLARLREELSGLE